MTKLKWLSETNAEALVFQRSACPSGDCLFMLTVAMISHEVVPEHTTQDALYVEGLSLDWRSLICLSSWPGAYAYRAFGYEPLCQSPRRLAESWWCARENNPGKNNPNNNQAATLFDILAHVRKTLSFRYASANQTIVMSDPVEAYWKLKYRQMCAWTKWLVVGRQYCFVWHWFARCSQQPSRLKASCIHYWCTHQTVRLIRIDTDLLLSLLCITEILQTVAGSRLAKNLDVSSSQFIVHVRYGASLWGLFHLNCRIVVCWMCFVFSGGIAETQCRIDALRCGKTAVGRYPTRKKRRLRWSVQ